MLDRSKLNGAAVIFFLPVVVFLAGCGRNLPEIAPVTGKVTYQGRPVTQGTITFYPEVGRSATGRIQPDGTYTLSTFADGDGALLGRHTVTVEAVKFTNGGPQPKSMEEEIAMATEGKLNQPVAGRPQRLVPKRYWRRENSDLRAEITSGDNEINFDLPVKKIQPTGA